MSHLISLCDGHGMETSGKRTPILPNGLKSETGNIMHENEFNRAVVKYLDVELKRCGFRTILVAPTDIDTPLAMRAKAANNAKADFYLSIHANAASGTWGTVQGIETLAGSSSTSKKYAQIVHKYLMQGTKLKDRGVKDGSWLYLAKATNMPFVLVECGFMDNLDEAKLLMSDAYRRECAIELAKAVCEIFNVKYVSGNVESKPVQKVESEIKVKPDDNKKYRLMTGTFSTAEQLVNGKKMLQDLFPSFLLYEKADSLDLNPTYRLLTGTLTGKNVAQKYADEIKSELKWDIYIQEDK